MTVTRVQQKSFEAYDEEGNPGWSDFPRRGQVQFWPNKWQKLEGTRLIAEYEFVTGRVEERAEE